MTETAPTPGPREVHVWDRLVRLVHWSVALLFLANAAVLEEGAELHRLAGYGLLALVAMRLAWGLVGTRHARFSAFPPDPRAALEDAARRLSGEARLHLSHNPMGALMAYALWAVLGATALTGMATHAGWLPAEAGEELHETFANLGLALAGLHVLGVAAESLQSRVPLVRAMVTGVKRIPAEALRRARR